MPSGLLSDLQRSKLETLAARIEASPHNLMSRRGQEELRTRHLPECVALAHLLPAGRQRLLDLGSGGGLPGLVLAIARPDLEVHLLDATQKKTAFLAATATELDLPVHVHTGRAEAMANPPLRGSFDLVTARAVAPLHRLIPWALPFLRAGGLLYAVKGARWAGEIQEAGATLRQVGARIVATPDDVPAHIRHEAAGDGDAATVPNVVIISRSG